MEKYGVSDLSFFWKTFLNQIHTKTPEFPYRDIVNISSILDDLDEKNNTKNHDNDTNQIRDEIKQFFDNHLDKIIYGKLLTDDPYRIAIFQSTIKRMGKCINRNITDCDKVCLHLLKLYLALVDERKNNAKKQEAVELILQYSCNNNQIYLSKIFNIGIELKHGGILEKLRNHVDLTIFLTKTGQNIPQNAILVMRWIKLLKLLKPIEYKQNI